MTRFAIAGTLVAVCVLGAAAPLRAQSLAEIARQEEERRKAVRTPGKLYTNESLRPEPAPSTAAQPTPPAAPTAPAPPDSQPAAGTPPAPGQEQAPSGQTAPPAPQGEAEWRKRMTTARDTLARSQIFAEALQSRINALTTDFVNRDDPAQRAVVEAERLKALAELDRVKQEIQQQQKAITAVQEDARRAGVPAGWVR
ncbi:MAG: hypothetical protein HYY76_01475 [Acidobacteria bacterium]|nr:hypothetical protein [Acidobacteriota bacterium]